MERERSLAEILETLRTIFGQDMTAKPTPRAKAVADPALWRALHSQQKCNGDLLLGVLNSKSDSR